MTTNALLRRIYRVSPEIEQHAALFEFERGQVFGRSGDRIKEVVFLDTGIISITATSDANPPIESGMVGSGGVIGVSALVGTGQHVGTSVARIRGVSWRFDISDLLPVLQAEPSLCRAFSGWQDYMLAQAQQLVVCAARHHLGPRLASWFLRAQHAANSACLSITFEEISRLLGLTRASVSVAAQQFKAMELISNSRGKTTVVDEEGLRRLACGCERHIRSHELRYFETLDNG